MKVNVESLSNTEKRLEISIPAGEVKAKFEEILGDYKKNVAIKGFRKGKVPLNVLQSVFGSNIKGDVTQDLVSRTFKSALEEVSLNPVTQPNITPAVIDSDQDFNYTAEFEVIPEFTLIMYKGIQLEKESVEVVENDIDNVLEQMQQQFAQAKPLKGKRGVRKGDFVTMEFQGFVDGKPHEKLKGEDIQILLGKDTLVPEFDENLLGMHVGDEKEFDVTYGEDYSIEELAGKTATFEVSVKDIKQRVLPIIDNEFAKDLGSDNVEDLRGRVREQEIKTRENAAKEKVKEQVADYLMEKHEFDLPKSLILAEKENVARGMEMKMKQMGVDPAALGKEADAKLGQTAERNVKVSIILNEIAQKEEIEVSHDDLYEKFTEMAPSMQVTPEQLMDFYKSNDYLESFSARLLEEKTIEFIIDKARLKEIPTGGG